MAAKTPNPDWMHSADTAILEFFRRNQPEYVPLVASRLGFHLDYVDGRCQRLVDYGLLEKVTGEAVYRLTERGEGYLAGDIAPADLPDRD